MEDGKGQCEVEKRKKSQGRQQSPRNCRGSQATGRSRRVEAGLAWCHSQDGRRTLERDRAEAGRS